MIEVKRALAAPDGWTDTPELAQIRACIATALEGADPMESLKLASLMITVLRDQVLTGLGTIRREAAHETKEGGLKVLEIAAASGQSRATILRLLSEYRAYAE